ncbi:MAG TPA: hypothetical protein EYH12_03040 [Psychromonas hadalis]|nr:hypothetical protein [Psychromonas hadalis]
MITQNNQAGLLKGQLLKESLYLDRDLPSSPKKAISQEKTTPKTLPDAVVLSGKKPRYPEVIQSSGYAKLDLQVIKFVGKERFMPTSKQGQKVSSEQLYSFIFSKLTSLNPPTVSV